MPDMGTISRAEAVRLPQEDIHLTPRKYPTFHLCSNDPLQAMAKPTSRSRIRHLDVGLAIACRGSAYVGYKRRTAPDKVEPSAILSLEQHGAPVVDHLRGDAHRDLLGSLGMDGKTNGHMHALDVIGRKAVFC